MVGPFVQTVDAFMAAEKHPIGADAPYQWQSGRVPSERQVKFPLEVDGEQHGQTLIITGYPNERLLTFRIHVCFPPSIARLDFTGETHVNTLADPLDYVPRLVRGPHFHPWPVNRRFFETGSDRKLHNAVNLPTPGQSFDAILRWFCSEARITLPARHTIQLPTRDLLI